MSSTTTAPGSAAWLGRFLAWQHRALRWLSQPKPAYAMLIFKTVIAADLALMLSYAWNLGSPRTAVIAVFLLMLQQSGLVFQKGLYRLIGTAVGGIVSVALIGAFAQNREMFAIGFALWIAVCTAGSFYYRNFKSYGFVLSGYTLGFVAIPAIAAPDQVFDIAINRVVEIMVGVGCATLVSDVLFPQRISDNIRNTLGQRLEYLLGVLRNAPAKVLDPEAMRATMLRFIGDAVGLETARVNAAMETSALRRQRQRLLQINHDYMQLSTTLFSLHRHLRRLHEVGHENVHVKLMEHYRALAADLAESSESLAVEQSKAAIARWRDKTQHNKLWTQPDLGKVNGAELALDYATGMELLERLAEELQAYLDTYLAYLRNEFFTDKNEDSNVVEAKALRFSVVSDPWLTAVAALRGFTVAIVAFWLWFESDWVWGCYAIAGAAPNSTLFAASPVPTMAIKQFMQGCLLALILGLIWNFVLMPYCINWVWLGVILIPIFILGAYFGNNPKTLGVGPGLYVSFFLHASLERYYAASLPDFIEAHLADFAGAIIAIFFYWIINPNIGNWRHKRIMQTLRAQVVEICRSPVPMLPAWLESSSRDLAQSITTRGQLASENDRKVFLWQLAVLEIGRSLIDFRREFSALADRTVNPAILALQGKAMQSVLETVAELFDAPSSRTLEHALSAVSWAIDDLSASLTSEDYPQTTINQRRQLRLDLHFIRLALIDQRGLMTEA